MNSKAHLIISLGKSVLRIVGCIFAIKQDSVYVLAIYFLTAEVLGIFEEVLDKR